MLKILCMSLLLVSAAYAEEVVVKKETAVGCYTRDDYSQLLSYLSDGDEAGFIAALESGKKCAQMPVGLHVYLTGAQRQNMIEFRVKGSEQKLWTWKTTFD